MMRETTGGSPVAGICMALLWLAGVAACSLPHGDDSLPDTGVPGRAGAAILRIEVPQAARRPGVLLPVQLEASVTAGDAPLAACVAVVGHPGTMSFPFGAVSQ